MCGIVGIVSTDQVNQQIYDSLLLLLHLCQDSTGIATMDGSVFHFRKSTPRNNFLLSNVMAKRIKKTEVYIFLFLDLFLKA